MPIGVYDRTTYNRRPLDTDWPSDRIIRLRALWDEGLSTAEIGRRLGVSKNSVVSKSHRLGLPGRPSPIRRREEGAPAPPRRAVAKVQGPTLPPMSAPAPIVLRDPLPVLRTELPRPKPVAALFGRVTECCFPEGEPGTRGFHYCDAPTVPGGSYCEAHAKRCYVEQHRPDPNAPVPHETPSRFSFARHGDE
jgi:GcrA cell cycle regulator